MKIVIKKMVVHNHAASEPQPVIKVTIGKLMDKTEINVTKVDEGIDELGVKVQEVILRSLNSIHDSQLSNSDKPLRPSSGDQNDLKN